MQTHTPSQNGRTDAEAALSVRDMIMQNIEPELCSDQLVLLDELYAGETPEEHAERMKRYERAYVLFDETVKVLEDDVAFVNEELRLANHAHDTYHSAAADKDTLQKLEGDIASDSTAA
jgi:hypothetical protein